MPPWGDKSTAIQHASTVVLLLAVAAMTMMPTAVSDDSVVVSDGDVIDHNTIFTHTYKLDVSYLYESRTSSSTVLFIECHCSDVIQFTSFENPTNTLVTSQYMKWDRPSFWPKGRLMFNVLPPNSYTHLVKPVTTGASSTDPAFIMRWKGPWAENVTVHTEDARLHFHPLYNEIDMNLSPHSTIHFNGVTIADASSSVNNLIEHTGLVSLSDESFIYFENAECINMNSRPFFTFTSTITISRNSALIIRQFISRNPSSSKPFFKCDGAITVDETSVFSLIDINTANEFKNNNMPLFEIKSIEGKGVIMFARVSMQKSGLTSLQPVNNDNFWVSAKATRSSGDEMTPTQLKEEKFNVNNANTMKWDGTDLKGNCVTAGLAIPGRATYKKVNGNCTATCTEDKMTAVCTKPYYSPCLVPNCQVCYRNETKRCLACPPHATAVGEDRCECNMDHCLECPTKKCTKCEGDYFPNKEGVCTLCVISHCMQCPSDDECTECAEGYKPSPDGSQCFQCNIPQCQQCSTDGKCHKCDADYKPANDGKDCFKCVVDKCQECKADGTCRTCKSNRKVMPCQKELGKRITSLIGELQCYG